MDKAKDDNSIIAGDEISNTFVIVVTTNINLVNYRKRIEINTDKQTLNPGIFINY